MKLANIYPVANQALYAGESYVMILAHLVKAGLYDPKHFSKEQYIIMDNGLYEGAQVSTSLQDCIDLAEASGIPVDEIIVPDVVNDLEANIQMFKENLETIRNWQHKYRFMFVAQSASPEECVKALDFIRQYSDLNLSVGISKLTKWDRASQIAVKAYAACPFPIHFLGIKKTFAELLPVCKLIRGCDTSQLAFLDKNGVVPSSKLHLLAYSRDGQDIDLAVDECDPERLSFFKVGMLDGFAKVGIEVDA